MRDAVSLLDQCRSFTDKSVTAELVREMFGFVPADMLLGLAKALAGGDGAALGALLRQVYEEGVEPAQLLKDLRAGLQGVYLERVGLSGRGDKVWSEALSGVSSENLRYLLERANKTLEELRFADSPRLTLELGLFGCLEAAGDLAAWVKRLEDLERRLASGSAPAAARPPVPVKAAGAVPASPPANAALPAPPPSAGARPAVAVFPDLVQAGGCCPRGEAVLGVDLWNRLGPCSCRTALGRCSARGLSTRSRSSGGLALLRPNWPQYPAASSGSPRKWATAGAGGGEAVETEVPEQEGPAADGGVWKDVTEPAAKPAKGEHFAFSRREDPGRHHAFHQEEALDMRRPG